jgi:D-3-phosphoglycerate dehydrogenase
VIATPHLGASTLEAQDRAGVEAAERVIEALAGG